VKHLSRPGILRFDRASLFGILALFFLSEVAPVLFAETEMIVAAAEHGALPAELMGMGAKHF